MLNYRNYKPLLLNRWPIICIAVLVSLIPAIAIVGNWVNYFPQYIVSAQITDFHLASSGKYQGYYVISYKYFVNGKQHTGGNSACFRTDCPKLAELQAGRTIPVSVSIDTKGNYVSVVRDLATLGPFILIMIMVSIICWVLVFSKNWTYPGKPQI